METGRGDAAAATRTFRGDGSRRRRCRDVDISRRRVAATPQLRRRENLVETGAHVRYYRVLVREADAERRAGFADLLTGLQNFIGDDGAVGAGGPFWGGSASLTLADCVLLPYAYRLYVLEHYRGADFAIPTGGDWARYHRWLDAAVALPSVARTLPDKDRYLVHVGKRLRRADLPKTSRGDAAAATWRFRGDESDASGTRTTKRGPRSGTRCAAVRPRTTTTTPPTATATARSGRETLRKEIRRRCDRPSSSS